MAACTRRAVLTAAGVLAATAVARKPHAEELRDLSTLVPNDKPAAPPAFGFTDADGKPLGLPDYRGHGLVVNFWATWCMPCVAELPSLDQLARVLAGQDVHVLPLSSDRGGAEAVRRFYAAHGIRTLPVLLDANMAAGHTLGLRGIPTTLLIDRDGLERGRFEGSADWGSDAAAQKVRTLVGNPARPETSTI